MSLVTFNDAGQQFEIRVPYHDNYRAKSAPERKWDPKSKAWLLPSTIQTALYINRTFFNGEVDHIAKKQVDRLLANPVEPCGETWPENFIFKTDPMRHQMDALQYMYPLRVGALFAEMGTGKTKIAIDLAAARWLDGYIANLLVICPSAIKDTWVREINKHGPHDTDIHMVEAGKTKQTKTWIQTPCNNVMRVMIVGVEALSTKNAPTLARAFCRNDDTMVVLDESSKIKNFKAIRTDTAIDIGGYAEYRLIMTGTEITQGIHDLYAQFRFLDWQIIGMKTFYSFRNRYCVMGGFEDRAIIGYDNVPELMKLVAPYTYHILKKDVMDLPPKTYETRHIEPTSTQRKLLRELKSTMHTEMEGKKLTVQMALEFMTRAHQIAGGHYPYKDEDGNQQIETIQGKNPKLTELLDLIPELGSNKAIIWCRFVPEVLMIRDALAKEYGPQAVETFYGATENRGQVEQRFQADPNLRFLVANRTASMGLTLTAATYAIYYSNSFSYEDRVQSEDRIHRKGQTENTTYIDLALDLPIERLILKALRSKTEMAEFVRTSLANKASLPDFI